MSPGGPPRGDGDQRCARGRRDGDGDGDVLSTVPPIAHPGHWTSALIYLAPVVIVVAVLFVQERRERRRNLDSDGDEGA